MKYDEFLATCKNLDPSAEINREKNLEHIKLRLIEEQEKKNIMKTNRLRKSAVVAAALAATISLSVVAYAAVPAIWRHFDTGVVQGEEFVTDFFVAEIDLPDGTTSVGMAVNVDRDAHRAAGSEPIILEVEGEEWVYLDELHLNSLEAGLALLQLDNVLIPSYLPEGFEFSRFTFPVNPNNHQYMMGSLPAAEHAFIYFTNGNEYIRMQLSSAYSPACEQGQEPVRISFGEAYFLGQQAVEINGNHAVLSHSLSYEDFTKLENTEPVNWEWTNENDIFGGTPQDSININMGAGDILYSIFTDSNNITLLDLVRIAESMK